MKKLNAKLAIQNTDPSPSITLVTVSNSTIITAIEERKLPAFIRFRLLSRSRSILAAMAAPSASFMALRPGITRSLQAL